MILDYVGQKDFRIFRLEKVKTQVNLIPDKLQERRIFKASIHLMLAVKVIRKL